MDKLKMHSQDKVKEHIAQIGALFPNTLTETIKNGKVEQAIDFDILKQELSDIVVEGSAERYQFTWPEKKKSILLANAPIAKTLRPCREESVDFDTTQNIYIEGDNLDALKLLQETYLRKVNLIYIDPPYNTGSDFIYEDSFSKNKFDYLPGSGQYDEEGGRLVANLESNGRYHTAWLNMIFPRLKLAKDLLSDDGVIFISIDDSEVENIRKICDEIFGAENFIAQFTVASNSAKNNSRYVSISHEYVVCYAKRKSSLLCDWVVSRNNTEEFKKRTQALLANNLSDEQIHSELLELVKFPRFFEFDHYTYVDKKGPFRASDLTAPGSKNFYDVIHPQTGKVCKVSSRGWAYSKDTMQQLINEDRVYFGNDEKNIPQLKNYLFENEKTLPKSVLFFDSQSSTKWMKSNEFGFDFPKATELIQFLLSMYPLKDITILDFFSGSATTAHAIMNLNITDNGHRKYILVQLDEETEKNSEAYNSGYKNICEIGKERIRRAGKKITNEAGLLSENLDIGFRVLKVDNTNMGDVYYTPGSYQQNLLNSLAVNIKPDRTAEDLLFQVMLDLGVLLSSSIQEIVIGGKKVYSVADGYLLACFDNNVNSETVTEIAKRKPYYAIFRDSSMSDDSVATNFDQIFATYSPTTVRKVL